jgi:hypothetical protein
MLQVVDSNYLQNPKLCDYLASAPSNYAILTDYAGIEAYQGNTFASIFKSMKIVSDFPTQIIVLKNTVNVCRLLGSEAVIKPKLVDTNQTSTFGAFCQALRRAEAGDANLRNEILMMGRNADSQLKRMLADAAPMGKAFIELCNHFTKEERNQIRNDDFYSDELMLKILHNTMDVALNIFSRFSLSPGSELYDSFIFRNALCCYLLALEWGVLGGANQAGHAKIRNDMVDTHFATYATYFDGLLSDDNKATRIYTKARRILQIIRRDDLEC